MSGRTAQTIDMADDLMNHSPHGRHDDVFFSFFPINSRAIVNHCIDFIPHTLEAPSHGCGSFHNHILGEGCVKMNVF